MKASISTLDRCGRALLVLVALATTLAFAVACNNGGHARFQKSPGTGSAGNAGAPRPTEGTPTRGMWVWGTRARLAQGNGTAELLASCRHAKLNEVYLSVGGVLDDPQLPALVGALADAGIRVEALTGEARWYQPEQRSVMLAMVDAVAAYNARVAATSRFVGMHFDIEPHQLPANKVDHGFLPALADTLREGHDHAAQRGLETSADLPRFALQKNGAAFAAAVPRIFVMLYELRDRSVTGLTDASTRVLDGTYASLEGAANGKLVVGLSADDYPTQLDGMLNALATAHHEKARYAGWAIHDEARYRAHVAPR